MFFYIKQFCSNLELIFGVGFGEMDSRGTLFQDQQKLLIQEHFLLCKIMVTNESKPKTGECDFTNVPGSMPLSILEQHTNQI